MREDIEKSYGLIKDISMTKSFLFNNFRKYSDI